MRTRWDIRREGRAWTEAAAVVAALVPPRNRQAA